MRSFRLLALVLVAACAGAPTVRPDARSGGRRGPLEGSVRYEARTPTFRGASAAVTLRPTRRVRVDALDASGALVGRGVTDDEGRFRIDPTGAVFSVRVAASIDSDGYAIEVTRDALGRDPHDFVERVPPEGAVELIARDEAPGGPGGAFHLLDTLYRGQVSVRTLLGARLPHLFAFWGRGVTTNWSFYEGEVPAGSGRYRLELLGGQRGRRATTDTDEHDEAVVLHELGHFVFDRLSSASSAGGQHPSGHFVDPGLAWEEGRATWFATVVLGRSQYTDTVGLEPSGGLQVHGDLEHRSPPPRGLGSQETVEEVLWDLVDGSEAIPMDLDHDGVGIEPVELLRAMLDLGREPGAFPCFPTFLRYVVDRGLVSEEAMRGVLTAGSLPHALLPSDGVSPWPMVLELERESVGRIDSRSHPAPSGGPRLPRTGYDAIHTYRLDVPADGVLDLRLRIDGLGDESDHTDLDLELRDLRADEIASSRGTATEESISTPVSAGTLIVRVVDGGADGARARYRLEARLTRR